MAPLGDLPGACCCRCCGLRARRLLRVGFVESWLTLLLNVACAGGPVAVIGRKRADTGAGGALMDAAAQAGL